MKYNEVMMETAVIWSNMSYCKRAKVGAVISSQNRIISTGYNGTISGAENCCEDEVEPGRFCEDCEGSGFSSTEEGKITRCQTCNETGIIQPKLVSKNTVVHAEANALMFATKNGIKTDGCTLYVTLSPCVECSKMMIQAGIQEVFYKTEYRITDGIEFLKENGIKVTKI